MSLRIFTASIFFSFILTFLLVLAFAVAGPTFAQDPLQQAVDQQTQNVPQNPPTVTSGDFTTPNQKKFVPLAGLPGFTDQQDLSLENLFKAIYRLAIVIGAMIAVIKITIAGFKYMGSDSVGSKGSAKADIQAALLGLLILLATVLIIETVRGGPVSLNILSGMPQIPLSSLPPPSVVSPVVPGPKFVKEAGCNQIAANGLRCPSEATATISGTKPECHLKNNIPLIEGQDTFKPVTEARCSTIGGNDIIKGGGLLYGNQIVTVKEMSDKYGTGKGLAETLDTHTESLKEKCKTMSGNPNATVVRNPPGGTTFGWTFTSNATQFTFTCKS